MGFKRYLESNYSAKFGYTDEEAQRSPNTPHKTARMGKPVKRFDIEYLVDILNDLHLGEKVPKRISFDQLQWGNGYGAVKLWFGTKYDVIISRLIIDLDGNMVWITKKMMNLNQEFYSGKEEVVAHDLRSDLDEVYNSPPDNASSEYLKSFKSLVRHVADKCRESVNDPLFFRDITEQKENQYIIRFGVRGHGVQAPDQHRVEQVQIQLHYDLKRGIIHSIETNVESSLGRHDWEIMPSDYDFYFAPNQSNEEIAMVLSNITKYF